MTRFILGSGDKPTIEALENALIAEHYAHPFSANLAVDSLLASHAISQGYLLKPDAEDFLKRLLQRFGGHESDKTQFKPKREYLKNNPWIKSEVLHLQTLKGFTKLATRKPRKPRQSKAEKYAHKLGFEVIE